ALAEDLRRYLAGWPIQARPVGRMVRMARWLRRRLLFPFLIVAMEAVLVIATVGATALWLRSDAAGRRTEPQQQDEVAPAPKKTERPKEATPPPSPFKQPPAAKKR